MQITSHVVGGCCVSQAQKHEFHSTLTSTREGLAERLRALSTSTGTGVSSNSSSTLLKTNLACLACVYRVMDARGKFGEHERSIRVARKKNLVFLSRRFATCNIVISVAVFEALSSRAEKNREKPLAPGY